MTATEIRGPVRRPEHHVDLDGRGAFVIEAPNLDALADEIEHIVAAQHPGEHVGVTLDADGAVFVRLGWAPSSRAGTWSTALRTPPFPPDPRSDPDRYWHRP